MGKAERLDLEIADKDWRSVFCEVHSYTDLKKNKLALNLKINWHSHVWIKLTYNSYHKAMDLFLYVGVCVCLLFVYLFPNFFNTAVLIELKFSRNILLGKQMIFQAKNIRMRSTVHQKTEKTHSSLIISL